MKLPEFQKYLQQENINLVFLTHPDPNITYFTQMKPSHAFLIIKQKEAEFLVTKLDVKPTIKNIVTNYFTPDWEKKLADPKIKTIGINKEFISVQYQEKLQKIYPQAKFIDISNQLKLLRSQKTSEEIAKISKACKITSDAFNELINAFSSKFQTEQDVAFFLERHMKNKGCEIAFPTIAATSKNGAIPHHVTSNQKLRKGFMVLDFGACYKHYNADMTRMVYLGKSTKEDKEIYNLLLDSQRAAINEVKDQQSFMHLDKIARTTLGKYSKYFIHSLGHGIGVEVHEDPKFKNHKINKNHTFTIEPGIYIKNKFGMRIEDSLVFNGKTKILTTAPKELLSLNI
ncbi:aminopeptidase P family protein [Candidatus Woesearchaeota archaeon]|nr:aminopeptidase P family protein [Candidatus Woesearchaeota archaeon]